jgi:prepilin peptidase CpaA
MIWLVGLSMAVGGLATVEDLRSRTISNWLCLFGLIAGLAVHAALQGWSGLGGSLLGALIGFAVFLIFFLLGGMGGGDIKLMAAFGAILGKRQIVHAAVFAAMVGGVMALIYVAYKKLRQLAQRDADGSTQSVRKESIPYAPAISLGVLISFLSEEELWTSVY